MGILMLLAELCPFVQGQWVQNLALPVASKTSQAKGTQQIAKRALPVGVIAALQKGLPSGKTVVLAFLHIIA